MLLNKTPEQWSKVDAEKVSRDCSSAHVMHLIADAKQQVWKQVMWQTERQVNLQVMSQIAEDYYE